MARRLIPIAIAASVLVGLFVIQLPFENSAAATTNPSVDEFVAPIVSISTMNQQRSKDQEAVIETLELELRALRVELMRHPDEGVSGRMTERLDQLLSQIKSLETN